MDTRGLHRDVNEVRIIIGPKFDVRVKLEDSPDELTSMKNLSNIDQEDPSGRPRIPCASQCQFRRKIADSYLTLEVVTTSFPRGKLRG